MGGASIHVHHLSRAAVITDNPCTQPRPRARRRVMLMIALFLLSPQLLLNILDTIFFYICIDGGLSRENSRRRVYLGTEKCGIKIAA